jgi:3-hydroxyisobutyrate dehydrogenase-like beta-hydroxyacid dehydrogenase
MTALRVAVIGLGEAGTEIGRDLHAAGCAVRGWDVDTTRRPAGVTLAAGVEDAVRDAELVLSLVTAAGASEVARAAAGALAEGAVYADLNTCPARLKRELAAAVEAAGARFADVAVMAPVPGKGLRAPLVACGTGAAAFAEMLRPLGAQIEVLPGEPGVAASRKLIRSVFMKGLAAALLEADAAARAAGCEAWFRRNAAETLAQADAHVVDRLLEGSRVHAGRRLHELRASADLLRELGIEPRITEAAHDVIEEIHS